MWKRWTLIILIIAGFASCRKVPLYAPEGSKLFISAADAWLPAGGQTEIEVVGFAPDGSYLPDGTVVVFSASGGSIDAEAEFNGGRARAIFTAGQNSGVAKIYARSGLVQAEPYPLEIAIAAATLETLAISAMPASLPEGGGESKIEVVAYDSNRNPLPDVAVTLSTTKGYFLSGKSLHYTDNHGKVVDWLVTEETAEVTAQSGSVSASVTVIVGEENEPPVASFTYSPSNPGRGEKVYFNASSSYDPDGRIERYEWDFGDGTVAQGERVSHIFQFDGNEDKTFTVVLVVYDDKGAKASSSKEITVKAN